MEHSAAKIAENRVAQAEEMEALQSIYGNDCTVSQEEHYCQAKVFPSEKDSMFDLALCLTSYFPELYPSASPPIAELEAPWLQESTRQRINIELGKLFEENVGDVVVFRWIEWLKDLVWLWDEARYWMEEKRKLDGNISRIGKETELDVIAKHKEDLIPEVSECMHISGGNSPQTWSCESSLMESSDKSLDELDRILGIVHGAPFTEKRSTFQAHLSPVTDVDQIKTFMEALMRNRKIAAATHNIMAYRIIIPEKGTILQDYDDDGENAAGSRLLHLLQIVDAINVVVVVSRWFGGILLGPDRFKHINNAARSLLVSCNYIKGQGSRDSSKQRKGKESNQKGKGKSVLRSKND